eukprot:COSAG01_NODE_23870_length_798_cov_27.512160_1_plen_114_part_01
MCSLCPKDPAAIPQRVVKSGHEKNARGASGLWLCWPLLASGLYIWPPLWPWLLNDGRPAAAAAAAAAPRVQEPQGGQASAASQLPVRCCSLRLSIMGAAASRLVGSRGATAALV